jgi:hypothetical protein
VQDGARHCAHHDLTPPVAKKDLWRTFFYEPLLLDLSISLSAFV